MCVSLPVFEIIEEMQTNSPEVTVCMHFQTCEVLLHNLKHFLSVLQSVYAMECNYPEST
jgi:hypothetical protein